MLTITWTAPSGHSPNDEIKIYIFDKNLAYSVLVNTFAVQSEFKESGTIVTQIDNNRSYSVFYLQKYTKTITATLYF